MTAPVLLALVAAFVIAPALLLLALDGSPDEPLPRRNTRIILGSFIGGCVVLAVCVAVLGAALGPATLGPLAIASAILMVLGSWGVFIVWRSVVGALAQPGSDAMAVRAKAVVRGAMAQSIAVIGAIIGMLGATLGT